MSKRRISMILEDGTKDGIMTLTDSKWNAGVLYVAPREKLQDLLKMPYSKFFGVYLLLSDKSVYVGQASELKRRVRQHHCDDEKWWTEVLMLTTSNDTLTPNMITFLEARLIALSKECNTFHSENGNNGNKYNEKDEKIVDAEDYLEQALDVIEFLGIKVFVKGDVVKTSYYKIVDQKVAVLKDKKAVIQYLSEKGLPYRSNSVSYAPKGQNDGMYAIDPPNKLLEEDWVVILNDTENYELIHIRVPVTNLKMFGVENFKVKNAGHKRIRIKSNTLMDISGFDFSKQEITRIKYIES